VVSAPKTDSYRSTLKVAPFSFCHIVIWDFVGGMKENLNSLKSSRLSIFAFEKKIRTIDSSDGVIPSSCKDPYPEYGANK
jgi:hypothetical protein